MAWTKQDVDNLKKNMGQGAIRVKTGDKEVEYRTLQEQRQLLKMMEVEAGLRPARTKKTFTYSKGLS